MFAKGRVGVGDNDAAKIPVKQAAISAKTSTKPSKTLSLPS
jgi:hypothetical protein